MIGEKTCENCGEPFYPLRRWALYCSRECNQEASLKRRRLLRKRGIDVILDAIEPEEITEAQKADRERRKNLTKEAPRNEIVEKAEEILNAPKSKTLADIGYGSDEDKK